MADGNYSMIKEAIENIDGFTHWTTEDNGLHEWLVANFADGDHICVWMWRPDDER